MRIHCARAASGTLKALDGDIIARLRLKPVNFELKHEIENPGDPIDRFHFLEEGMASMTTTFKDGSQVEVGTFGYESVIGVSALMGTKRSLNRVYIQIAGHGYTCHAPDAEEFGLGGDFQSLTLRYVQAQLVQAMQSAGCNAKHNFEQRLARWLLICADRAHINTFKISHEFLADMLGGRRPTISTTAGILKKRKGLIEYTRGEVRILDLPGLTKTSCECYLIIKDYLDNYTMVDSAITA